MANAFGRSQSLSHEAPACSDKAQSHMENVRKSEFERLLRRAGRLENLKAPDRGKTAGLKRRAKSWGGDQGDPRLFYFRALLESDRFFGGRRVEAGAVKGKQA